MATTEYGLNANETVKLWSRKLFREALNQTVASRYIGEDTNSIVQVLDDTSKGPGDRVRVQLRMQLSGDGTTENETQEGNEEALVTHTDDLLINELGHAVRSEGVMTVQRIPWSIRNEARLSLQDWFADRIDTVFFNQLAGNNAESRGKYGGFNTITAPDSDHHFWAGGETADEGLTAAATFSLTDINVLREKAEILDVPIRPVKVGGEDYYVLFMHPIQVTDLRNSTTTLDWGDIQKAALQGGKITNNPIFTGALGVYNKTILISNTRVPLGVNSSSGVAVADTRRAIFCGAQAGVMAFGRGNGPNQMTWVEDLFDYERQLGVRSSMIFGMKRTIFDSDSFGSIVYSTYAAAH